MATQTDERWNPIPGYVFYEASNRGRIRSLTRTVKGKVGPRIALGTILRSALSHGYLVVVLCDERGKRTHKISCLVAAAFIGPRPDGFQVAHWNGDRIDDRADNLVYETPSENTNQKFDHGTMIVGSQHKLARLTEHAVLVIRQSNLSQRELASIYSVDQSIICRVKNGQVWRHVS